MPEESEYPKTTDELTVSYLRQIEIDQVGLWQIPSAIQRYLHISDTDELRAATVEILRSLLSYPDIVAAEYHKDDDRYHVWEKPMDDIINSFKQEWIKSGSAPQLGDDLFILMHRKNLGRQHGTIH